MKDRNEWFEEVERAYRPDDAIERIGTLRDFLQAEAKKEGSEK